MKSMRPILTGVLTTAVHCQSRAVASRPSLSRQNRVVRLARRRFCNASIIPMWQTLRLGRTLTPRRLDYTTSFTQSRGWS